MQRLKHLVVALLLLNLSGSTWVDNVATQSIGLSITVDVTNCTPATCGGGGS